MTVHAGPDILPIIACPEDKACPKGCPPEIACEQCRAPLCSFCWKSLRTTKTIPGEALANDMLIFYPPRSIYTEEVTFMELVCASPCFTAMACFSLEKKYLGGRAMDQDALMLRHRLIARGNATTFPLAWEDLLTTMQSTDMRAQQGTLILPKVGAELAAVVNVIIKSGDPDNDDVETAARVVHQARVRRAVVIELLRDAKERGHPAYRNLSLEAATQRAEELPEDGVPPEIIALLEPDDNLEKLRRQKAATPMRDELPPEDLRQEFATMTKHNAVVAERTSGEPGDANAQHVAALEALAALGRTTPSADGGVTIYTGNRLLDQFEPCTSRWLSPFCFRSPPLCPTRRRGLRNRDTDGQSTHRGWSLPRGCAVWRGAAKRRYRPAFDEHTGQYRALTSVDVEAGAQQLVQALNGTYQEARRHMRFEIAALRVRCGAPLFVTVSPDEAHQWLFIRMSRTRRADPVRAASPWQEWMCGDRNFPPLDDDIDSPFAVERVTRARPIWQQRRALLARDPLASVDGFQVLLRLLLRDIFGLRVCAACPECHASPDPCMDCSGSNASLLGGVFGRMDAGYVSIEAQKSSGSLHGHMQCFVQCLHQHTPLLEIFDFSPERLTELRREYCAYNSHVAHSTYSGRTPAATEAAVAAAEATWPEHASDRTMTSIPGTSGVPRDNARTPRRQSNGYENTWKKTSYSCKL